MNYLDKATAWITAKQNESGRKFPFEGWEYYKVIEAFARFLDKQAQEKPPQCEHRWRYFMIGKVQLFQCVRCHEIQPSYYFRPENRPPETPKPQVQPIEELDDRYAPTTALEEAVLVNRRKINEIVRWITAHDKTKI